MWVLVIAFLVSGLASYFLLDPAARRVRPARRRARRRGDREVRGDAGQGGRRLTSGPLTSSRLSCRSMRDSDWPRIFASSGTRILHRTNPTTTTTSRMTQNIGPAYAGGQRPAARPTSEAQRRRAARRRRSAGAPGSAPGRPRRRARRAPARAPGSGEQPAPSSAHQVVADRDGDHGDGGEAEQQHVEDAGAIGRRAGPPACVLPGLAVGGDVAQVVGHQDRAGERADADGGVQRGQRARSRSGRTSCRSPPPARRSTKTITSPSPR